MVLKECVSAGSRGKHRTKPQGMTLERKCSGRRTLQYKVSGIMKIH